MINIALAPDNNYVMPASVAITSILENKKSDICIFLLYLENNLSEDSKNKLKGITAIYSTQIEFVELSEDKLKGFPVLRHGLSAYLRMFAPQILPDIDKLLYLDCDLLVEKPLDDLYNVDIERYDMAAVMDLNEVTVPEFLKSIGCNSGHYVNTGVLLMNLKKLRTRDIIGDTVSYLNLYKDLIKFSDQDILNGIIPDILLLPPKYNSTIHLWNPKVRQFCLKVWSEAEIEEGKKSPVIIHYLSAIKPWHWGATHPLKHRWYYYLEKTPYCNYKPKIDKKIIQYRYKMLKNYILMRIILLVKFLTPNFLLDYVHKRRTA